MSRFPTLVFCAGCVLALALLLAPLGVGQEPAKNAPKKAAIDGHLTDSTQALVIGAIVVLSNGSGWKQETKTGAKGEYAFTGLEGGTYNLTITAPGFVVKTLDDIELTPGSEITLDLSLEVAAAKSEVSVVGENTGQVEVEKAEISGTITQTQLTTIGLNGRNFTQLIALVPGVSNQTGQDEAKVGVQGSVKYSVNGGRVESNIFEVDGSDVLNTGLNGASSTLMVYPSIDAIQETKVLTSNFGAQFGRTGSGIVQVTTKSGGSQFHGNLYEFLRNEAFNAKGYFDPGDTAPLYRRNDFGGTIGGPLTIPKVYNTGRTKTFFFFSEEARMEKTPTDYDQAVPSLKERGLIMTPNGIRQNLVNVGGRKVQVFDFSDVCPPAGSSTYNPQQYPDCPFGAGQEMASSYLIPATVVDKTALAVLDSNLIPLPNSPAGCNYSVANFDVTDPNHCYDAVISAPTYWREELFRIDHNVTDSTKLSFRYIHDAWNTTVLAPEWSFEHQNFPGAGTFPTVQNNFTGPGLSMVGTLTNILSTTLVNNLSLSYVESHITLSDQNGPGGAQYQLNPSLYQPLVANPANPGVCNPALSLEPGGSPAGYNATYFPQCGMGYIFNNGFGGKMPGVAILGTNAAYGGTGFAVDPSYMPWSHTNPTYSVRDDISKAMGKHTFDLGAQFVYYQRNQTNNVIGAASGDQQGLLTFDNLAHSTGNAFADFLVGDGGGINSNNGVATGLGGGYIQSYTQDSGQQRYYQRYQIAEPYLQDDWKATLRLTLNLGVRVSLFGTYSEKNDNVWNWEASRFDPSRFAVDPNYGTLLDKTTGTAVRFSPSTYQLDPGVAGALGLVQCGVNGTPASCMKGHLFNPAPRIGFAWDPRGDGKTSIRGGYGIFYEHGTGNEANTGSLEASSPVVLSMTQPNPPNYMCIGNVGYGNGNNGICGVSGFGVGAPPAANSVYALNVTAIPTQAVWPYAQQWSFGAQRQLATGLMLDVAYVGSKGTHLTVERQLNQAQPLPGSENPFGPNEPLTLADCTSWTTTGRTAFVLENGTAVSRQNPAYVYLEAACEGIPNLPNVNSLPNRPYPGLGEIYSLENVANSSYNSLQMKLQRTAGPLTAGVVYVYSHSIDDSSDRSDPVLVNSYDLQENRASSDFDQRSSLSINYLYRIPGAGLRNFLRSLRQPWCVADDQHPCSEPSRAGEPDLTSPASRWGRIFFDGWELSGLTTLQSGTPFSVINSAGNDGISLTDNAGVAEGLGMAASYPDLVPAGRYYAPPATAQGQVAQSQSEGPLLGNPLEFVAPRGLTFGDAGRNFLNNPRDFNSNLSLLKNFRLNESAAMEFRAEVFNIFNNTQFRIYDPNNAGSSGNNVISCYAGPNNSAGYWAQGGPNCTSGASFLHAVDAHRPRTMQFGLKLSF